jgi:hypothetical protein
MFGAAWTPTSSDEAAVYSDILALFSLEHVSRVVVHASLEAIDVPPSVLAEMPELSRRLLKHFQSLHAAPSRESTVLRSMAAQREGQLVLVGREVFRAEELGRPEAWARFYEAHPNAQGLSTFSHVAFDKKEQQALVSVRTRRYVNDLSEVLLLFVRSGGAWQRLAKHVLRVDNGILGTGPQPWQANPSKPTRYRPRLFLVGRPPEGAVDEFLVYQAVLHSFMGEGPQPVVLRGTTVAPPKVLLYPTASPGMRQRPLERLTREQSPAPLNLSASLASNNGLVRIVEEETLQQRFPPGRPHAMEGFRERYPNHVLLAFSRVQFDEQRSNAACYVERWQPGGSRRGTQVTLRRLEGGWWLEGKQRLWTSPEDTLVDMGLSPGLSTPSAVLLAALRAVCRGPLVAYDALETVPPLSPEEASRFEALPRDLLRTEPPATPARFSEGLPASEELHVLDEQGARSLFLPDDQRGWDRVQQAWPGAPWLVLLSAPSSTPRMATRFCGCGF